MDIKTINTIARTLKGLKPNERTARRFLDFDETAFNAQVEQWDSTVLSFAQMIQDAREDFNYHSFLRKCGYK